MRGFGGELLRRDEARRIAVNIAKLPECRAGLAECRKTAQAAFQILSTVAVMSQLAGALRAILHSNHAKEGI